MKITPLKFPEFLKAFNFKCDSLLIFGPDENLLTFKVIQILETLAISESFKTTWLDEPPSSLEGLIVTSQPSLFAEKVQKTVWVIPHVKDKFLNSLEEVQNQLTTETLFILMGPDLPVSSKIVKFHEQTEGFYCLGVYEHSLAEKKSYIQSLLEKDKVQISSSDLNYLTEILPTDPHLIKMEIEKLSLYRGDTPQITLETIKAIIDPEISEEIDTFIHSLCLGDKSKVLQTYYALKQTGHDEMIILRSLNNHFTRLLQVAAAIKSGTSPQTALEMLKPRLFFKTKDRFLAHLSKWSPESLFKALALLKDSELWLKSNQNNIENYCSRNFLKISSYARSLSS